MKTDINLYEERYTFIWRPIYIYMKTDRHFYEDRYTFIRRQMFIYMKTDIHFYEDRYTLIWRQIYIYMKTDINFFEDRYTFIWWPIHIYMNTDIHLYEDWYTFFYIISLISSENEEKFRQICREIHNTNFIPNNYFFLENRFVCEIIGKYCAAGQATEDNVAHAHCMPEPKSTNTPSKYITHCFSTATVVAKSTSLLRYTYMYMACFVF